jgi:hypothetical protein
VTHHVKNWNTFQHYKERSPPWIKLHRTLLDDKEFHDLPGEDARFLVLVWLLASEDKHQIGTLPTVPEIAFRLRMTEQEVRKSLKAINQWLVSDASPALASGKQETRLEAEAEAEKRQRRGRAEAKVDSAHTVSVSSLPLPALPAQTRPTRQDHSYPVNNGMGRSIEDTPPKTHPPPSLAGMNAFEAVRFAVASSKTKAQPQLEAIAQSKPVEKVLAAMEQVYRARCEGRLENPGGLAHKLLSEIQS